MRLKKKSQFKRNDSNFFLLKIPTAIIRRYNTKSE